jgi:hypothetical protein
MYYYRLQINWVLKKNKKISKWNRGWQIPVGELNSLYPATMLIIFFFNPENDANLWRHGQALLRASSALSCTSNSSSYIILSNPVRYGTV